MTNDLSKYLSRYDIEVENSIIGCSPLAMVGKTDPNYDKHRDFDKTDNILTQNYLLLNIRKNLNNFLSHNSEDFCDNITIRPLGLEVSYHNLSDCIVVMNSSMLLNIYYKSGVVYSDMSFLKIKFTEEIKNDKSFNLLKFPYSEDFGWKFYYDKFIDAILNEYDNKKIVLIASNVSQWYMDGDEIGNFDLTSCETRKFLHEVDMYFAEKTNCEVIYEHFNHIPPMLNANTLMKNVLMSQRTVELISKEINEIVRKEGCTKNDGLQRHFDSDTANMLIDKLSSRILSDHQADLDIIENKRLSVDKIKKLKLQENNEFFGNLVKLEKFLSKDKAYTLSSYVIELNNSAETPDIELVELYTKYFKLDINDIIAIYRLFVLFGGISDLKGTVKNIINNPDALPILSAEKFKKDNLNYLKNYPFIPEKYKETISENKEVYIPLENNNLLVLCPDSDTPISKIKFNEESTVDFWNIINNNYSCTISCVNALTYSYDYYVEKARKGDGDKPTYLTFTEESQYFKSLSCIDYRELLENERFVFKIAGKQVRLNGNYTPVTDLTELFDPDLVTVRVQAGLNDQIAYYVMGQMIQNHTGRKVIYDNHCYGFNGLEVTKFAKKPMRLLEDLISKRLNESNNKFINIFYKINKGYSYFIYPDLFDYYKLGIRIFIGNNYKKVLENNLPYTYMHVLIHCQRWKLAGVDCNVRDYIEFPPLEEAELIEIQNQMLNCDSVVIHVRRGDYIKVLKDRGEMPNYKYYVEAIQKIMALPYYPNKKYFVFSDDIPWCETHKSELGLDSIESSKLFFVKGNKYDKSFRDMQLMSNGKIMIGGNSGFFDFAVLYSKTCEIVTCFHKEVEKNIQNKYDIGEIKEKYLVPYSETAPKSEVVSKEIPQNIVKNLSMGGG